MQPEKPLINRGIIKLIIQGVVQIAESIHEEGSVSVIRRRCQLKRFNEEQAVIYLGSLDY